MAFDGVERLGLLWFSRDTGREVWVTGPTLTAERSDLVARATELQVTIDTLTTERDAATAQVAELDQTIARLTAESDGATTRIAWLEATIATRTGQRDDLVAQVAELEETIATLTAERDDLVGQVTDLESDLAAQTQLTAAAVAERRALAKLFPIEIDVSIQDADLVGTYDVELTRAYCQGFANCATLPAVDELAIRRTSEGYLELVIDGFVTAGMLRVDGAFYATADATTAVAACAGEARVARIEVTMYGHGLEIAADGTPEIDDLGAGLSVQAPAMASCPAGLAIYGAQITPQA